MSDPRSQWLTLRNLQCVCRGYRHFDGRRKAIRKRVKVLNGFTKCPNNSRVIIPRCRSPKSCAFRFPATP